MNIKSLVAYTSICLSLCACTTPQFDTRTDVFLLPVHSITTGLEDSIRKQIPITDNDGNLYVTYWDSGTDDHDTFATNAIACRDKLSEQRLFLKNISIADLSEEQIKPSVYVPFIKCVHALGYNLIDKQGYAPDEYNLSFSRTHASRGDYLPVGGTYILRKQKIRFLEVYLDVKACEAQALEGKEDAAVEEYGSLYVTVSVEGFAEKIKTCLQSRSYTVEEGRHQR
jgi:hypothetical protein